MPSRSDWHSSKWFGNKLVLCVTEWPCAIRSSGAGLPMCNTHNNAHSTLKAWLKLWTERCNAEVSLAATTPCRLQLYSVLALGQQAIRSADTLLVQQSYCLQPYVHKCKKKGNQIREVGLIGFRRWRPPLLLENSHVRTGVLERLELVGTVSGSCPVAGVGLSSN